MNGDLEKNNHKKDEKNKAWWQPALVMFIRLSVWIAVPIILAMYFGRWLDNKYDSEPWLFLISIGVAFFVSMIGLVKNTVDEYKKIDKEFNKNKEK